MNGINAPRLLLGGALAGVVVNLSEFTLNSVVFAGLLDQSMSATGAGFTAWAMPYFVAMAFLWGYGLTAAYAAARPRLGAGFRSAVLVGLGGWLYLSVLPSLATLAMGVGESRLIAITLAWTAIELPLATTVGAWAYQEDPRPSVASTH